MQATFRLDTADYRALYEHLFEHVPTAKRVARRFFFIWLCVVIAFASLISLIIKPPMVVWLVAVVLGGFAVWFMKNGMLVRRSIRTLEKPGNRRMFGEVKVGIEPKGLRVDREREETLWKWKAFGHVTLGEKHIFGVLEPDTVFVIPSRGFPDTEAFNAFFEELSERVERSKVED